MTLRQLLLEFIPSKEIKTRFSNKQITVNQEIVDLNTELFIQDGYWELGDFVYLNINHIPNIVNIRNIFGQEPTNIKCLEFLTGYTLISISKNQNYVFINL